MGLNFSSLILSLISLVFLGSAAYGADSSGLTRYKAYWICKSKKEVRTVRVEIDPQTKLCSTIYNKLGSEKLVGSGQFPESCISFLENVKSNLEKSNWACRDVSATKISSTAE